MSTSPTARTLERLRKDGWTCQVVEHFNVFARKRQDLFGFADVLAIRAGLVPLAVQVTTGSNSAARLKKARALPALRTWLQAGCRFEVWAWSKRGPMGKRKTWDVRRLEVSIADLVPSPGRPGRPALEGASVQGHGPAKRLG